MGAAGGAAIIGRAAASKAFCAREFRSISGVTVVTPDGGGSRDRQFSRAGFGKQMVDEMKWRGELTWSGEASG